MFLFKQEALLIEGTNACIFLILSGLNEISLCFYMWKSSKFLPNCTISTLSNLFILNWKGYLFFYFRGFSVVLLTILSSINILVVLFGNFQRNCFSVRSCLLWIFVVLFQVFGICWILFAQVIFLLFCSEFKTFLRDFYDNFNVYY